MERYHLQLQIIMRIYWLNTKSNWRSKIEKEYNERLDEIGEQVPHDMVMFAETERERQRDI